MTSSSLVKRVIGATVVGVIGLTMLLYALEATSLLAFAARAEGGSDRPPLSIYVTLFVGLVVLSLSAFWILKQWSEYVREHPDVKHLPVWFLVVLIVLPGSGLIYSVATHSAYIQSLAQVPAEPNLGYVAFQVIMAALVIIAIILLAVRWAPGYKRVPPPSS